MAMSRGERPRVPSRQAASLPPASTTCSTGQSGASNGVGRRSPGAGDRKAGALRMTAGGASASSWRTSGAATGSFRLATKIGSGVEAGAHRAPRSGRRSARVAGLDQRAVEDQGGRAVGRPASVAADRRGRRPSPASRARRAAAAPARAMARRGRAARGIGEELRGVVDAAVDEVLPEPVAGLGRQVDSRQARDPAGRRPAAPRAGCRSRGSAATSSTP